MSEDIVTTSCGAATSHCPDFSQIPTSALVRLANRFEMGKAKYGRDNWRKGLNNKDYVLERINHGIFHLLKVRDKIERGVETGEDDIGAILWCGAFLSEADLVLFPQSQES